MMTVTTMMQLLKIKVWSFNISWQHWAGGKEDPWRDGYQTLGQADWHCGSRVAGFYQLSVPDVQRVRSWPDVPWWPYDGARVGRLPYWQQCGIWLVRCGLRQRATRGECALVETSVHCLPLITEILMENFEYCLCAKNYQSLRLHLLLYHDCKMEDDYEDSWLSNIVDLAGMSCGVLWASICLVAHVTTWERNDILRWH